jgi:hypothetical protein
MLQTNYLKCRHGLGVMEKEFLLKNKEMNNTNNLNTISKKLKKIFMKHSYQLEEILFSKYPLVDLRQKELVRWLETTAQSIIGRQNKKAKKINLRTLKETPAIYLS